MFKLSLILVTMLTTFAAQAEKVECSFTEPFISVTFDPAAMKVSHLDAIENKLTEYTATSKNYTNGIWRVTWIDDQGGNRALEYYTERNGGSDGMSDFIFPLTGKLYFADGHDLIGGCETASEPAFEPHTAPFPGCYEVLRGYFEDGASYYMAVGEKIIDPLKANPKTEGLGTFLESALVVQGYMELSLNLCKSIDEAVK